MNARIGWERCFAREADHRAGVQPAAEVAADRDIGPQTQTDGLVQDIPEALGILGIVDGARALVGARVVEVPVPMHVGAAARRQQVVAGQYLEDAVEEAFCAGCPPPLAPREIASRFQRAGTPAAKSAFTSEAK